MDHSRGFSLIETVVAVAIASMATMALMRVVSYTTMTSATALERFDSSVRMSLALESVEESKTISISERLNKRYSIDHPLIRDALQSLSYEVIFFPKENISPLDSIAIQKVIFKNSQEHTSFFRITSHH